VKGKERRCWGCAVSCLVCGCAGVWTASSALSVRTASKAPQVRHGCLIGRPARGSSGGLSRCALRGVHVHIKERSGCKGDFYSFASTSIFIPEACRSPCWLLVGPNRLALIHSTPNGRLHTRYPASGPVAVPFPVLRANKRIVGLTKSPGEQRGST